MTGRAEVSELVRWLTSASRACPATACRHVYDGGADAFSCLVCRERVGLICLDCLAVHLDAVHDFRVEGVHVGTCDQCGLDGREVELGHAPIPARVILSCELASGLVRLVGVVTVVGVATCQDCRNE